MKRSNRLVLLIGIFLAIVAFVLILLMLQGGGTETAVDDPTRREVAVVVAAVDIPLGAKIQASDLTTKNLLERDKPADSFVDPSFVIGQTARQDVTAGQLITNVTLGTSGGGTITTIDCPAGLVCMAVQVDQVSGVGTLTKAGDYVDMIVAFTAERFPVVTVNPDDDTITTVAGLNGTSVKALLQGLQVVGTLLPPPPADTGTDAEASPGTGNETVLNGQQQIVIVAATTQQAEVIKFAQVDGSMSLVLRSGDDFRDPATGDPLPPNTVVPVTTSGITLKGLIDDYGVLVPELVEVILPEQPGN